MENWYIVISINNKQCLQHRNFVENNIWRKLTNTEQVHHLNWVRDDNRLENLTVVDYKNHHNESYKLILILRERILELESFLNITHDEDVKKEG